MTQITYSVICKIDFETLAQDWLDWLNDDHIEKVIKGGASSAQIIKLDKASDDQPYVIYEIRYLFDNREAFDNYIENHATQLRLEGLEIFPPTDGFHYERKSGEIISTT